MCGESGEFSGSEWIIGAGEFLVMLKNQEISNAEYVLAVVNRFDKYLQRI